MIEVIPPATYVLIAAGLLAVLPRRAGHAVGVVAGSVALFTIAIAPEGSLLTSTLFGFDVVLYAVDPFNRIVGIVFAFIGVMAVIYAWASEASRVHTAFALSYVGTSLGAVFVGDWLTLIFFWELMALTSTLLVWEYGGRAVRPGFRYGLLHGVGGSVLLIAVVWHYALHGSFAYVATEGIAGGLPAILAAIGIGVNVGMVGLHAWLPDTYPRPHIAASVFLCIFTTKTGVYVMFRAFPDGHLWIAYMGGAMAVFGAFAALFQRDMRRLLAYGTQSQVGYMVAGLGISGALATNGAFAHVFNHVLYESLLFMTVGVVIYRTGRERFDELGGLWRSMPITAASFFIGAAAIAGFPGFNGFVSKGMVIQAAHYEHLNALWGLLLLAGVGIFLTFIKLGYFTFIAGSTAGEINDANTGQSVVLVAVASLCVVFGLVPGALFALLPSGTPLAYTTYTISHVSEGLALGGIALVAFVVGRDRLLRIEPIPDVDAVYNPIVFYGLRTVVRGVTELFAEVDRRIVRMSGETIRAIRSPERIVAAIVRSIPLSGDPPRSLRASIGAGAMLVVGVILGLIWLVAWG